MKEITIIRKVEKNDFIDVSMRIIAEVIISYLIILFFPISIIWIYKMEFPWYLWIGLSTILSYIMIAMEFYEDKIIEEEETVFIKDDELKKKKV